jgi:signal peptidase
MRKNVFSLKKSNIISISLQVVLFVLLLISVGTFVSARMPLFGTFRSFVVLTGSMEPALPVSSLAYVQKQEAYGKGSIITFQNMQGQDVTHRVANVQHTNKGIVYITKGDANQKVDSAGVPSDKVTGKVFFSLPYLGKVINFLNTPQGFISFVILPSAVLIIIEFMNIKKELEKQIEKRFLDRLHQSAQ